MAADWRDLVVFMISDGFDMGIGCLLPLVARNDDERRIVINSVGAHWEGNPGLVDPRWWGIICRGPECMQRRFPAFMWR